MIASAIGRLTRPAHPVLFELLYEPQLASDRRNVLPYLLRIDAAHVVMLAGQGLRPPGVAAELLALNLELGQRLAAGEEILGAPPAHRGLYFLYEQEYIQRLGQQVGGAAHMARSRNDVNATVTRMRLRDELLGLLADGCDLLDVMGGLAGAHLDTLMCGFTHLQPAQPTTLGHYLTGVLSELVRSAEWLDGAFEAVSLEATSSLWPALEGGRKALRLTRLLLEGLEVFPARMLSFLHGTQTNLTSVADLLVSRYGLAFRTAHEALGRLARETRAPVPAGEARARLETILRDLLSRPVALDEAELERCLDPGACVQAAAFGGGPAPPAVRAQLRSLAQRQERLRERLQTWRESLKEAEIRLREAAAEIRGVQSPGT